MTNRELGNHQSIISVLTKFPALWISQSQKDPFLPNYIYRLCKYSVNGDNPRKFSAVKVGCWQIICLWVISLVFSHLSVLKHCSQMRSKSTNLSITKLQL